MSFFTLSCSHYNLRKNAASELFGPIEDMHIREELQYPNSPFNDLVQDAFKNNRHYINLLNIGDEALLIRIHLIRMARRSINIQTFIWGNDNTEKYVTRELLKAANRGVKVNIIVDALASDTAPQNDSILATADPNIRIKYYNPVLKKVKYSALLLGDLIADFRRLNQRMHNKLFIVDDRIAITGGRNHRAYYFDRGRRKNLQDRGCLAIGPVVRKMTDSFMDYWAFKWSVANYDMLEIKQGQQAAEFELGNLERLDREASDYAHIKKTFTDRAYLVDAVGFVADGPGKAEHSRAFQSCSVAEELSKFLSDARESLLIQTPYLILPKRGMKVFQKLRRNHPDIDIRISSNSLSTTDNFMAYAVSCQNKKKYLKKLKWRIFEFKRHPADADLIIRPINVEERIKDYFPCIHAKTYVVDNKKVFIGSFNIDPRSTNLNTEAGLFIYDSKVAEDVTQVILRDMAPQNSWTIAKRKKIPVVAHFSGLIEDVLKIVPIIDVWPYTYSTSFGLIAGKEELPFYHSDFYKHYRAVGLFPDVAGTQKSINPRLFKALFGKVTEPLI